MPLIDRCCCFDGTLRTGSRNAARFSTATAGVNICMGIWALVSLHRMTRDLEENEQLNFMAPGLIPICYIEFFLNIARLFLSLGLWVGINRGFEGRWLANLWLYTVPGIRIIEIMFDTYILTWMGKNLIVDVVYVVPEFYLLTMYFVVETFILIACILVVISYYQEVRDEFFHKHYRTQHFLLLSRARSRHHLTGGSSLGPSLAGSRMTIPSTGYSNLPPHMSQEKMHVHLPGSKY